MAIGNCLLSLRTHDVGRSLQSLHFFQPDEGVDGQIRFLVMRLLQRKEDGMRAIDPERVLVIRQKDFFALRKIYLYIERCPSLTLGEDARKKLFILCMKTGLGDVPCPSIRDVFSLVPREARTREVRLALTSLLQGNEERIASATGHLRAIKEQHRTAMLLLAESFPGYQVAILEQIAALPQDELPGIISLAKDLLKENAEGDHFKAILQAFVKIPQSARQRVVASAKPLIKDITSGQHIAAILRAVNKIYWKERAEIVALTVSFKNEATDGEHIRTILQTIKKLPKKERAAIVEMSMTLIEVIPHDHVRAAILRAIHQLRMAERTGHIASGEAAIILALAKPLMKGISNPAQLAAFLEYVKNLLQEEAECRLVKGEAAALVAQAEFFIEKIPDSDRRIELLNALQKIPKEERPAIAVHAKSLMEAFTGCEGLIDLFSALKKIPKGERSAVVDHAKSFIKEILDCKELIHLLHTLQKIPKDERSAIVKHTESLMDGVSNRDNFLIILKAVAKFRPNQYPIVATIKPFVKDMKSLPLRANFVAIAAKFPIERLTAAFETASTLIIETAAEQRAALLAALMQE